ncbi:MAG: 4-hydroxy-tetrahydrodipicolinate reductase [Chloroflexi bacterium]|nr:4-hydroxy-tetrahydrodipicolinate reductase [Chloroflexota bacterium]
MKPIRVAVHGAQGKMGQEVISALCRDPETRVVGAVEQKVAEDSLTLPDGSEVLLSSNLESILKTCQPDVMVDFSVAKASMPAIRIAAGQRVNLVVGTTGFTDSDINEMRQLATEQGIGMVVAANFALGAILMIHLAKIAAKYLDYAEIIELHHHLKLDAPSGTALSTARAMAQARGKPFQRSEQGQTSNSRGEQVEGIAIHSVRLPGLLGHQEVIMGAAGQTLSIRHDTISRECYMPGVMLAVKEVVKRPGFTYGLDTLLNL